MTSQQIKNPVRPNSVSNTECKSSPFSNNGLSGCQRFFFWYWPRIEPFRSIQYATLSNPPSPALTFSLVEAAGRNGKVPGTRLTFNSLANS